MEATRHWHLVRYGNAEDGIALMREAYQREPSASHAMRLGAAYLWLGNYKAAGEHFHNAIQSHPFTISSFYEMAGTASWCLDDASGAVEQWRKGLGSQFADAGVAISPPLLLFAASVLRPRAFSRTEAKRILKRQLEDPRSDDWPGPLAEYVLGRIDEEVLVERCTHKRERTTLHRRWQAQFYEDVVGVDRGSLEQEIFRELMRRATDTSQPEWEEERNFLTLLWSAEFFIARHEAGTDR